MDSKHIKRHGKGIGFFFRKHFRVARLFSVILFMLFDASVTVKHVRSLYVTHEYLHKKDYFAFSKVSNCNVCNELESFAKGELVT